MILRHSILLLVFIVQVVLSQQSVTEEKNPFLPGKKKAAKKTGYKNKKQNGYGSKKGKKTNSFNVVFEDEVDMRESDSTVITGDDDDDEDDDFILIPAKKSRKSKKGKKSAKKGYADGDGIKGKKRGGDDEDWEIICDDDVHECDDGTIVSRDEDNECDFESCPTEDDAGEGIGLKTLTVSDTSTSTSTPSFSSVTFATMLIVSLFLQ